MQQDPPPQQSSPQQPQVHAWPEPHPQVQSSQHPQQPAAWEALGEDAKAIVRKAAPRTNKVVMELRNMENSCQRDGMVGDAHAGRAGGRVGLTLDMRRHASRERGVKRPEERGR